MIQRWKLRRELNRLGEQIAAPFAGLYEHHRQKAYDRTRDAQIKLCDGAVSLGGKVAVFLVYQPRAVALSIDQTCAYLHASGYAILLVANGGLPEAGRERLKAHVWRFLDRPNYGYDFGGYRDAILKLEDWNIHPARLLILNDSIWSPVHADNSPLSRAEAIEDAATGMLVHTRASRERAGQPERDGMIESYFISVPDRILRHAEFRAFWRDLRLSNFKTRVIHRGERGFSKALHAAKIPIAALSSRLLFLDAIAPASAEFLRTTLRYAAYIDDDLQERGAAVLAAFEPTQAWRAEALDHIAQTVMRRRFNATFYWAADRLGLTNFLKKNRGPLFVGMRRSFVAAVADGNLPKPPDSILGEIAALSAAEAKT